MCCRGRDAGKRTESLIHHKGFDDDGYNTTHNMKKLNVYRLASIKDLKVPVSRFQDNRNYSQKHSFVSAAYIPVGMKARLWIKL
jgi:hypothetical protein